MTRHDIKLIYIYLKKITYIKIDTVSTLSREGVFKLNCKLKLYVVTFGPIYKIMIRIQ